MSHQKDKTMQHEDRKSQHMKTYQRLWQALVVASQATKARHPGKTALDHPSAWQQDESTLGLGQFDDFQAYSVCLGRLGRLVAGVPLINESQVHALSRRFL